MTASVITGNNIVVQLFLLSFILIVHLFIPFAIPKPDRVAVETFCFVYNSYFPVGIYLLKVNNRNNRTNGVVLVFLLLTLNIFHTLL